MGPETNFGDDPLSDRDNLAESPLHLLHRAGQRAGDIFQSEMSTGDLTPRQYAVLVTVSRHEGLSQTNLVEKTGIDRSTLADIIRRMLKKGLLQRRRTKEDARAYAVKLTDEGRQVLANAEPLADRVDERVLSVLPDEQRKQFLHDLNLIIEALGRVDARAMASSPPEAQQQQVPETAPKFTTD
ncbi:MAG: MarR family winged helix-turn-helix transcriptional regulator [Pseudomonadota bacterium]